MTQKYLLMPFVFFQFHSIVFHFPLFTKSCDDVQRERYMSLFVIYQMWGGILICMVKKGVSHPSLT